MNLATPEGIEIAPAKAPFGQTDASPERTLLSIMIPVRDAAGSLPATLNAITHWIPRSSIGVEVVIIDDGSSDTTRATASSFGRRIANLQVLRHVERRGHLEAIRTGEGAASGELIAFGRVQDLEWSLGCCTELVSAVLGGADLAILPVASAPRVTPVPKPRTRGLAATCVAWLRGRVPGPAREPALVVCRASALKRMIAAAHPADVDPDWATLARRAQCALRIVRRERSSAPSRLLPAPTA
jgi:glycosyltransferase involved in cell wall biosynthesis